MADPIAFMVMPFGRRPHRPDEPGVPAEVDFDALWFRVYRPVLTDLGNGRREPTPMWAR